MGNITINIWMILAVILSVGMIGILGYSIYRGIQRCNSRIDDQNDSLQRIDGLLYGVNDEITNIKIDQATLKAVQSIKGEDNKVQLTGTPIHIYQHQSPHPYTQQLGAQPQHYYYDHQVPQQVEQPPQQQAPRQFQQSLGQQVQQPLQQRNPQPVQQPLQQSLGQPVQQPLQQSLGQPVQQPLQQSDPQTVQQPLQQRDPQPMQQPLQLQPPQRAQQDRQVFEGSEAPVYHQTRVPVIGLTEFQLPEEYDIELELKAPKRHEQRPEIRPQTIHEQRPEIRPQPRPEQRPEIRPQQKASQRLSITPQKEKVVSAKFNSLNDGISRTGKRYSEEELANRILD